MSNRIFIRGAADAPADLDRPLDLVAHVVRVALHRDVDARVEHLQAERDLLFLAQADDLLHAGDHVLEALFVGQCRARMPENVITLGKPAALVASMLSRSLARHSS